MKYRFLIIALLFCSFVFSQNKGTISGIISDKDLNNEPLPFASVSLKGTTIGVSTDMEGKYSFAADAGSYTLVISFVGYETAEIPVTVMANEKLEINRIIGSGSVTLEDVVLQNNSNREKETALLLDQKNAVTIKQTIGAQEMSRKGVSDAEGAMTKMTGVTKQQGEKNVFVRGLTDRYNSTSLNGMPLPSENPLYKNISLNFFSSDIIKSIGVNKTFGSEIYGDVGGANIDIQSKELTGNQGIEVSVSSGANSQTFNKDQFLKIDGGNWLGSVANKNPGLNNLSSYGFDNNINTGSQSLQLNSGLSVLGGRKFNIGENVLSVFLVGAFNNSYNYSEGTIKQTNNVGAIYQDQEFEKFNYNVSQTVMGNFKYKFRNNNTVSFNSLFIHDNTQSIGEYSGADDPQQEGDLRFVRRQQINNNNLFVNQLLSSLKLNEKWDLDLGAAFNMIRGNEPDRRSNNFLFRDGKYVLPTDSAGENDRYFSEISENDLSAKAVFSYKLSNESNLNRKIDFGYNFRSVARDFEALIFNHRILPPYLNEVDPMNPDGIFNQENLNNGVFELQTGRGTASNPRAFVPFTYNGDRSIHAALGSFTYQFNSKFTAVVGARFEKVLQEVEYDTNLSNSINDGVAKIDETYILPNFNLKYNLSEKSIIRAAASMTYTLPQFIEVAPFRYQDVSFNTQGNPNLVPSENYNFDLKWELYPKSDEIFALTGFFKYIDNPIARSEIPSGGNTLTFFNVGGKATALGLELEMKKNIFKVKGAENSNETTLAVGANVSYMSTKQQLDEPLPQFTKDSDELQGASPLLANADISFRRSNDKYSFTSALVVNYFSDRIFSIGTTGYENVIEKGIPTLDFITNTGLGKNFGISLKVKNILNPDYRLVREFEVSDAQNVTLSTYKLGIDLSIGLTYKF